MDTAGGGGGSGRGAEGAHRCKALEQKGRGARGIDGRSRPAGVPDRVAALVRRAPERHTPVGNESGSRRPRRESGETSMVFLFKQIEISEKPFFGSLRPPKMKEHRLYGILRGCSCALGWGDSTKAGWAVQPVPGAGCTPPPPPLCGQRPFSWQHEVLLWQFLEASNSEVTPFGCP